ncbi:hypothetical protein Tco_1169556 [Tanacetum coccineum]
MLELDFNDLLLSASTSFVSTIAEFVVDEELSQALIMEYMMKISKKARILELKQDKKPLPDFEEYAISTSTIRLSLVEPEGDLGINEYILIPLLSDCNNEMEADEDEDPNDVADIFKIESNLFDFETPLCKAFNEFNYLLKIDTNLFTFDIKKAKTYEQYDLNNNKTEDLDEPCSDIDGFYNGGELPGMVRVGRMTYFQDHKWYDKLTDGKVMEEDLMHKAKFKESWGDATPGVMKLCAWLKSSFENFHELDYDVLVKLEECLWKDYDTCLDANRDFDKNYGANDAGSTQGNKEEHHDPSRCNIRRFEMIKYSFGDDEEYVAIEEDEYDDGTNTSKEAIHAYQEIFHRMDGGWMVTRIE